MRSTGSPLSGDRRALKSVTPPLGPERSNIHLITGCALRKLDIVECLRCKANTKVCCKTACLF
jgi:hypothetical protein